MEMSEELKRQIELIESVFFARARDRKNNLIAQKIRLAHYTSAESAEKILRSKSIWLRDTRCMTDFSEIQHGYDHLLEYFSDKSRKEKFISALNLCSPDAGTKVLQRFNSYWAQIQTRSYVCCLSEHPGGLEDLYGRLSMWRAYAPNSGVALVVKPPSPYGALPLNVALSPVEYFTESQSWEILDEAISRVEHYRNELGEIPHDHLIFAAYRMLVFAALSLKHPVFQEEREWRLVYLPFETPSEYVKDEIVSIKGIPQKIYKVNLKNNPEKGITGIAVADIFDRIIIGPSQYAGPIHASMFEILREAGIEGAENKLIFSNIPLRT